MRNDVVSEKPPACAVTVIVPTPAVNRVIATETEPLAVNCDAANDATAPVAAAFRETAPENGGLPRYVTVTDAAVVRPACICPILVPAGGDNVNGASRVPLA